MSVIKDPLDASADILQTLARLMEDGQTRGDTPLPLQDPRDLADRIVGMADALQWSSKHNGQLTERRGRELGAYTVAFLMSLARARETDVAAGDAA